MTRKTPREIKSYELKEKRKRRDIIFLILFISAVVAWGVGYLVHQEVSRLKPADRERAEVNLQEAAQSIQLPGELVYEVAEDRGCQTNDLGYYGQSTVCVLKMDKYYKNNQNLTDDLEKASIVLENLDWENSRYSSSGF